MSPIVDDPGMPVSALPIVEPPAALLLASSLDAVTELLEWANDGVGADPSACQWLAHLRLARTLGLETFPGAPPQLAREIDDDIRTALQSVDVSPASMSSQFPRWTASLTIDRMGTRSHPLRDEDLPPHLTDRSHVLRALPLAFVEHLEPVTVYAMALDSVAVSVSDVPEQHRLAALLATLQSALTASSPAEITETGPLIDSQGTALGRQEARAALPSGRLLDVTGVEALRAVVRSELHEFMASPDSETARRLHETVLIPAANRLAAAVNPARP